jgi:hypothetical protein
MMELSENILDIRLSNIDFLKRRIKPIIIKKMERIKDTIPATVKIFKNRKLKINPKRIRNIAQILPHNLKISGFHRWFTKFLKVSGATIPINLLIAKRRPIIIRNSFSKAIVFF